MDSVMVSKNERVRILPGQFLKITRSDYKAKNLDKMAVCSLICSLAFKIGKQLKY